MDFVCLFLSFADILVHTDCWSSAGWLFCVYTTTRFVFPDSRLGPADPLRSGARLRIVRMPTVYPSSQQPLRRVSRRRWVDYSHSSSLIRFTFLVLHHHSIPCFVIVFLASLLWDIDRTKIWSQRDMRNKEKMRKAMDGGLSSTRKSPVLTYTFVEHEKDGLDCSES